MLQVIVAYLKLGLIILAFFGRNLDSIKSQGSQDKSDCSDDLSCRQSHEAAASRDFPLEFDF